MCHCSWHLPMSTDMFTVPSERNQTPTSIWPWLGSNYSSSTIASRCNALMIYIQFCSGAQQTPKRASRGYVQQLTKNKILQGLRSKIPYSMFSFSNSDTIIPTHSYKTANIPLHKHRQNRYNFCLHRFCCCVHSRITKYHLMWLKSSMRKRLSGKRGDTSDDSKNI